MDVFLAAWLLSSRVPGHHVKGGTHLSMSRGVFPILVAVGVTSAD